MSPFSPLPKPLRILYVTATSDRGGAETLLLTMLSRFDPEAIQCRVVSFKGKGWLTRGARAMGIEAYSLGDHSLFQKTRVLFREIHEVRPHIIHAFGLRAEAIVRPLSRLLGVPVLVSAIHSTDPNRSRATIWLDRWTSRFVNGFIAVGHTVAKSRIEREGFPRNRMVVIPNGIAPPEHHALERRESLRRQVLQDLGIPTTAGPILLMVGNLRPMKGHDDALSALSRMVKRYPDVRLIAVGKDVSDGRYERRSRTLGLERNVVWTGYEEDPGPFYAAADVFLMPSHWEGCPTALLEAMSWGLPVVASNIGGIAEVARPNKEAILVPPRSPDRLADAVVSLLDDPPQAEALAEAARNRILENYTLQKMIRRHLWFYEALWKRNAPSRLK